MLKIFAIRLYDHIEYGRIGVVNYSDGTAYEIWKTPTGRLDLYSEMSVLHLDLYAKGRLLLLYLAATY